MPEIINSTNSLKGLLNNIDDLIFQIKDNNKIKWCNKSAEELFNDKLKGILFQDIFFFYPNELTNRKKTKHTKLIIKKKEVSFEHTLIGINRLNNKTERIIQTKITNKSFINSQEKDMSLNIDLLNTSEIRNTITNKHFKTHLNLIQDHLLQQSKAKASIFTLHDPIRNQSTITNIRPDLKNSKKHLNSKTNRLFDINSTDKNVHSIELKRKKKSHIEIITELESILKTEIETALAIPLINNNNILGTLYIINHNNEMITSEQFNIEVNISIQILKNLMECRNSKSYINYYKEMVNKSKGMIAYIGSNGEIKASNAPFQEFHKSTIEKISKTNIFDFYKTGIDAGDHKMNTFFKKSLKGKKIQEEIWHLNKDLMHLIEIELYPLEVGMNKFEVIFYSRDTTEKIQLEAKILEVMHEERKKVGISLHDHLGHDLLAVAIKSRLLSDKLQTVSKELSHEVREIEDEIKKSINEVRRLSHGLIPFKKDGLEFSEMIDATIINIKRNYNLKCTSEIDKTFHLENESIIKELYYIIEESIANSVKHSKCTEIHINVSNEKNQGVIKVLDNGKGFSKLPNKESGIGLEIMKYRARSIGGDLLIESSKKGSVITCTFSLTRIHP